MFGEEEIFYQVDRIDSFLITLILFPKTILAYRPAAITNSAEVLAFREMRLFERGDLFIWSKNWEISNLKVLRKHETPSWKVWVFTKKYPSENNGNLRFVADIYIISYFRHFWGHLLKTYILRDVNLYNVFRGMCICIMYLEWCVFA